VKLGFDRLADTNANLFVLPSRQTVAKMPYATAISHSMRKKIASWLAGAEEQGGSNANIFMHESDYFR
jgi:hypothetical protein